MVDIHSHILPGVDDGAKNADEALKLLSLELQNGVKSVCLTPHFNPSNDTLEGFLELRTAAFEQLKKEVDKVGIKIEFALGAEVFFSPAILDTDPQKLCLGKSDYMLVEFPFKSYPSWARDVFYRLMLAGITPIIAHVERYSYFVDDIELLAEFVDSGCLAQINADCIAQKNGMRFIKQCIKRELVHFVASDTHHPVRRPPQIKKAMDYLVKKQPDFARKVTENSEMIRKTLI